MFIMLKIDSKLSGSILNSRAMVAIFMIFGNGCHPRWLTTRSSSSKIRSNIVALNGRAMIVIFVIMVLTNIQDC